MKSRYADVEVLRRRRRLLRVGADESQLLLAVARATVAVPDVAVVALFAAVLQAVAADRGARAVRALRLEPTVGITTVERVVVAVVTLLGALLVVVAADRRRARAARGGTLVAVFELALRVAAVVVDVVAVVAVLGASDDAVATFDRDARQPRRGADPAGLDAARRAAPVVVVPISVVADFGVGVLHAVPAERIDHSAFADDDAALTARAAERASVARPAAVDGIVTGERRAVARGSTRNRETEQGKNRRDQDGVAMSHSVLAK